MSHILKATGATTAPFERKVTARFPPTSVSVVPGGSAPTTCRGLAGLPGLAGSTPKTIQPCSHGVLVQVTPLVLLQICAPPCAAAGAGKFMVVSFLIASLRAVLRLSSRFCCCTHC